MAVRLTREEAIERLCKLGEEVRTTLDLTGANDCFCGKGGFWSSPSYAADPSEYRNDGEVIEWIESAVRTALRTRDNGSGI